MTNVTEKTAKSPAKVRAIEIGTQPPRDHRRVVLSCVAAFLGMCAMSYAAVPLYRLFCQVTGFSGTPQRAERAPSEIVDGRLVTVRFDANVTPGMAWKFEPVQHTVTLKVGENALAFYRAENTSDKPITGTASFNVAPDIAGAYFSKIECFCFTEQTLAPGQSIDMPVSFFVDPSIMNDRDADSLKEITLSYTFYPSTAEKKSTAETDKIEPPKTGKGS